VPLLTTAINDRHVSHRHGFRLAAGFYHVWGALLEAYHKLHPKPKSISKLKEALQKASHYDWRDAQKLTVDNSSTQNGCQTSDKVFTVLFQ